MSVRGRRMEKLREAIGDVGVTRQVAEPLLNRWLRKGIRKALAGPGSRLRMDPERLGELLAAAIDCEVERLERLRAERKEQLDAAALFAVAEKYFVTRGDARPQDEKAKALVEATELSLEPNGGTT